MLLGSLYASATAESGLPGVISHEAAVVGAWDFVNTPLHNQNNTSLTLLGKTLMRTWSLKELYSDFNQCVRG